MLLQEIHTQIYALSEPNKIAFYTHFFRADEGDICYGDKFLATKVPELRKLVKKYYKQLTLPDLPIFLKSEFNDIRFFGQQIISQKYKKAQNLLEKKELIEFLTKYIDSINHWNLVDTTADLWGKYCLEINAFGILTEFSKHDSIWIRRIGIVACLPLLRTKNKIYLEQILEIITNNIGHEHEYIHKAIGWILREVGKLDEATLIVFLAQNWQQLTPTTKSYATEKLRKTLNIKQLFNL